MGINEMATHEVWRPDMVWHGERSIREMISTREVILGKVEVLVGGRSVPLVDPTCAVVPTSSVQTGNMIFLGGAAGCVACFCAFELTDGWSLLAFPLPPFVAWLETKRRGLDGGQAVITHRVWAVLGLGMCVGIVMAFNAGVDLGT